MEIRAKAYAAEIKARQLDEEEKTRKQEFKNQLELKGKIQMAQEEAELARLESKEGRKTREARDEAVCLAAEALVLENSPNDSESLANRLHLPPGKQSTPDLHLNASIQVPPTTASEKPLVLQTPITTHVIGTVVNSKPLCSSTPDKS